MHGLQIVHTCINNIVPVTLYILKYEERRKDGQQKPDKLDYWQIQQEVEPSFD